MSSTPQLLPFAPVFDYLYEAYSSVNQAPPPVPPGTEVKVTLQTTTGVVDAPAVLLDPGPFSAKTDQNGFWELWLVPNTHINAGNSWYSVQTSTRVYDIFVGNAGGQSQSLIINAPTALPPGATILSGPLTVPGLLTAQGGLSATGPISFPANSIPIADITPPVAVDSTVLHKTGAEAVAAGAVKDFTLANPIFAAAAIPESAIAFLLADLAARVLSAAPVFSPGTVAAAALAASIPRGTLGFVSVGADGATAGAAELTVNTLGAITVPAGRRIKLTSFIWDFTGTVVNDIFEIRFKQGGTILQGKRLRVQTGLPVGGIEEVILTPGAGTYTWSVTLIRTAGTGVLNFGATTYPAWLAAEDIGV